jgi:hypothetical protein
MVAVLSCVGRSGAEPAHLQPVQQPATTRAKANRQPVQHIDSIKRFKSSIDVKMFEFRLVGAPA